MKYSIVIIPGALRELHHTPEEALAKIVSKIDSLSDNPRPIGSIKLSGVINHYRIRIGDYRVIYKIEDQILTVIVIKIGHRREIYR